jgi:hypothetical protein
MNQKTKHQKRLKRRNVREIARYRQSRGFIIADLLESVANGDANALAEADILREAARNENLYVGKNLNRKTGELFDGLGALYLSGSRLDPFYRAFERTRTRKKVLRAINQVRRGNGESWRFITLTIPCLVGVDLATVIQFVQSAWQLLRKRKWWKAVVKAGIKSVEFTLGDEEKLEREQREWDPNLDGYHVHLHLLVLSKWIDWPKLGDEWTICLKNAATKLFDIPLQINTAHGRAIVDVRLVTDRKPNS